MQINSIVTNDSQVRNLRMNIAETKEVYSKDKSKGHTTQDQLREICNRYPEVSIVVVNDDGSISDNYQYESICDTQRFSYPGIHSYIMNENMLKKMSDSQYKKDFYSMMDDIERKYNTTIGLEELPYKCIKITETGGVPFADGGVIGSSSPMRYYIDKSNNKTTEISLNEHKAIMKQISFYANERYNIMINEIFHDGKKDYEKEMKN